MPVYVALFWACGLLLLASAWRWGEWPERTIATAFMVGTIATRIAQPAAAQFQHIEVPILLIDLAVAAVFLWVALKADRAWPMIATGLLAPSLIAHIAKIVNPKFHADGYSIVGLSAYLLVPVIAIGVARQRRRAMSTLQRSSHPVAQPARERLPID